jgi:hypothetical protein
MTRKNQRTRKKRKPNETLELIEVRMYREALRLDKEREKTKRIYEV